MQNWIERNTGMRVVVNIAECWDDNLSRQQNLDQIHFWLRKNDALRDAIGRTSRQKNQSC